MKTIVSLKKASVYACFAVLACMMAHALDVRCQTAIYENRYIATEHSIIKNYDKYYDIKYDIWPTSRFEYVDRNSNLIYTVNVGFLSVQDFEIYDGYVYFCGGGWTSSSKESNHGAVFGYFNIDSVFFYNGNIHYCVFSGLYPSSSPSWLTVKLHVFSSIDVAIDRNMLLHLAMTGELYKASGNESASFVADALRKSDGTWALQYTADYGQTLTFCDVASTKSSVIVTGVKDMGTESAELFYIPFEKPAAVDSSFFNLPACFGSSMPVASLAFFTSNSIVYPFMSPRILGMQDDDFAIVCRDTSLNSGSYVVSVYGTPFDDPVYRFFFGRSSSRPFGWAYNKAMKTLCVIGWSGARHIYTLNYPYSLYNIVSTQIDAVWLNVDEIHGMKQFVVSGSRKFREENVWAYDLTSSGCINLESRATAPLDRRQHYANWNQLVRQLNVDFSEESVKPSPVLIEVICR